MTRPIVKGPPEMFPGMFPPEFTAKPAWWLYDTTTGNVVLKHFYLQGMKVRCPHCGCRRTSKMRKKDIKMRNRERPPLRGRRRKSAWRIEKTAFSHAPVRDLDRAITAQSTAQFYASTGPGASAKALRRSPLSTFHFAPKIARFAAFSRLFSPFFLLSIFDVPLQRT